MKELLIVSFLEKNNKYSFNAIIPNIEILQSEFDFDIKIFYKLDDIIKFILNNSLNYKNIFLLFSILTSEFLRYKDIIFLIKNLEKEIKTKLFVICGGPHIIGNPSSIKVLKADIGFIDEAEISFQNFIKYFFSNSFNSKDEFMEKFSNEHFFKNTQDKYKIKDIYFKLNNIVVFFNNKIFFSKRKKETIDLNSIKYFSDKYHLFGPIEITRGCFFNCAYCQVPQISRKLVRHRSIEYILELIDLAYKNNIRDFRFISPDAASYNSYDKNVVNYFSIYNLLKSIRNRYGNNIKIFFGSFPSEIRPDNINDQLLQIIKNFADNKRIIIGAQSGDDYILDKIKREHNVETVLKAVDTIIRNGFEPHVDFIFGLPYEQRENKINSINFIKKIISYGAKVHSHYFMPLPGTAFYKKEPTFIDDDILKEIRFLEGKERIYGKWQDQFQITKKCSQYFEDNL
jgi:B12-binding domain/radical SAM domain protein